MTGPLGLGRPLTWGEDFYGCEFSPEHPVSDREEDDMPCYPWRVEFERRLCGTLYQVEADVYLENEDVVLDYVEPTPETVSIGLMLEDIAFDLARQERRQASHEGGP